MLFFLNQFFQSNEHKKSEFYLVNSGLSKSLSSSLKFDAFPNRFIHAVSKASWIVGGVVRWL